MITIYLMNMKLLNAKRTLILSALLIITTFLFAEALGAIATSTLEINATVGPNNKLTVEQTAGAAPGLAIALDAGNAVVTAPGTGVPVGVWRVKGNTTLNLYIVVTYSPFEINVDGVEYAIPYQLYNGNLAVSPGGVFATLQRQNGIYPETINNGTISIKRVDEEQYPASNTYITTITFTLLTD
jgi:hypothetical protein